jgi:YHS domain-containing protein
MADTKNLGQRIDAAFAAMDEKRKQFQDQETKKHKEWDQRVAQLGKTFDSLREVWKPPLELLIKKFGDKVAVTPTLAPSTRDATLDFQSDVAKVRLRFRATTDDDIRKLILNYDLDIIPMLMKYDSHAELEMPLEAVDRAAVGRWIDERIMSFVKAYLSLHENQYYLKEQMVQDPVTGTQFPKFAAGATLEHEGGTHYFVSEETRREFEKKRAGTGKATTAKADTGKTGTGKAK